MQLPSLQRNSLSEHLRMSRDAMRQEFRRIIPILLWFQGRGTSMFLTVQTALPAAFFQLHQIPGAVLGPLLRSLLPWTPSCSQSTTHRTVRHCCHHSHCPHHSATDSGCSSRSGRGTRPPHTPGGLWAQMSQAAVHREHIASKPLNKAFWSS